MNNIIKIQNLQRTFEVGSETVHALKGISFEVAALDPITALRYE